MTKFKIGDRVRVVASDEELRDFCCNEKIITGYVGEITEQDNDGHFRLDGLEAGFVKPEMIEHDSTTKPRPHRDLIIAWADGGDIQFERGDDSWVDIEVPSWGEHIKYRLKPTASERDLQIQEFERRLEELKRMIEELKNE